MNLDVDLNFMCPNITVPVYELLGWLKSYQYIDFSKSIGITA